MGIVRLLAGAGLLLLAGCFAKPQSTGAAESRASIRTSSGANLAFSSEISGTIAVNGDRIQVVRERKFKIDAEVYGDFNVGDLVFIDLYLRTKDGKLSSCANSIAKVEAVSNAKATFHTDFYVTKLPEQDCTLKFSALLKDNTERTELAEAEVRIVAPH